MTNTISSKAGHPWHSWIAQLIFADPLEITLRTAVGVILAARPDKLWVTVAHTSGHTITMA